MPLQPTAEGTEVILRGTIETVVYRNDANDYTVLEVADEEQRLVTAVGTVPFANEGEFVVLRGTYSYHKEYGRQLNITSYEKTLPSSTDGILKYLSSRTVRGVGPVTALKIVNRFGDESFDVMENHPEWLADIPGITMKKAAQISASFREQNGLCDVMLFCKDFMDSAKITRVYKAYGSGAIGKIKENPYVLCESRCGLSFEKTDRMAAALGVHADHPDRLFHGFRYLLTYNAAANGHTCLPEEKLVGAAADLLSLPEEKIKEALAGFLSARRLSSYRAGDVNYIMTVESNLSEECVAAKLFELCMTDPPYTRNDIFAMIEKSEALFGIRYAALQREALFETMQNGVLIVTGGPGTGKTTVVKAMISVFRSQRKKFVLAAPTGRAAKRLSEATGEEAKTLHRMLEMERGPEGAESTFRRNEKNPLEEQVIIVDEASMIDLQLMQALVRALPRRAKLILIGDTDQLPSVGAGNILGDLVDSGKIRTVRLTEIFRQAEESRIVTNAHLINEGRMPVLSATDGDFFFVGRSSDGDVADAVADLVTTRLPRAYGRDIASRIQVITPSRKGSGGVENINTLLQEKLNPPGKFKNEKISHGVTFREGDRVMQVCNNYEIEWVKDGIAGSGLFNGDIGRIVRIDAAEHAVKIVYDDKEATYGFDQLDEIELAYAITVHKSQGSEYPVVVIPMYACPPMLRTRNLLYTAVTRARKMVILVGRTDIVRSMVENNREILRYTTLKERIRSLFA